MMDPGHFRLHTQADPALDAGTYHVHISAETTAGLAREDDRYFEVTGPRLALAADDVAATSPPARAAADFSMELPYLALLRRTLPWERSGPQAAGGMWLALLVTRESPNPEAVLGTGPLNEAVSLSGVAPHTTVSLLRVNASGVPVVRAQFGALAARCHVREVSLADTATMGPDDDGWQAVVIGARLPLPAAGPGVTYRATLVSLEGRTDLPLAAGATAAAFVALFSWTFTSLTGGPTFETLVSERLTIDRYDAGVTLPAVDRSGNQTTVTYRPPMRPHAAAPGPAAADDVSARAAYELGRLLAAADGRLLRELVAWRRARQWAQTDAVTEQSLAPVLAALGAPPTAAGRATQAADAAGRRSARAAAAVLASLDPALPLADRFDTGDQREATD